MLLQCLKLLTDALKKKGEKKIQYTLKKFKVINMDFKITKEQKMYQDSARDFFSKEWSFDQLRESLGGKNLFKKNWEKMADLGWLALLIDEKYSGIGADFLDLCPILEEMGRALYPSPFFVSSVIGASVLSLAASDAIKEQLLPAIANGDLIVTMGSGQVDTKLPENKSPVTVKKEGKTYTLNGTIMFVPYADISDYLICRGEDSSGKATLFLVENKISGIKSSPIATFSVEKYDKIILKNVKIPEENIIGGEGSADEIIEKLPPLLLSSRCMEMIGGMQRTLDVTVEYLKARKQFGKPLGTFQALQHKCADMAIDVDSSRFIVYKAAWKISNNMPCRKEASSAKAWAADAYQRVTKNALQAHGATGFTDEYNLHYYYKQAKSLQLMYGGSAYHRDIVADEMGY